MDEGMRGILSAIGRMLQAEHTDKMKKEKKDYSIESKLAKPKKKKKLTGEEVYQNAMRLFPKEKDALEGKRWSPRSEPGF